MFYPKVKKQPQCSTVFSLLSDSSNNSGFSFIFIPETNKSFFLVDFKRGERAQMKNGGDRFVSKKDRDGLRRDEADQNYSSVSTLCFCKPSTRHQQQGSSRGDKFPLEIQRVRKKKKELIKTTTKQSCLPIISRLYLY